MKEREAAPDRTWSEKRRMECTEHPGVGRSPPRELRVRDGSEREGIKMPEHLVKGENYGCPHSQCARNKNVRPTPCPCGAGNQAQIDVCMFSESSTN